MAGADSVEKLEDVIVHDAFQMAAEDLAGIDLVESVPIPARQKSLSFAGVEQRAIGRHRHDHIVSAEIKMLGDLYRGDRHPKIMWRIASATWLWSWSWSVTGGWPLPS